MSGKSLVSYPLLTYLALISAVPSAYAEYSPSLPRSGGSFFGIAAGLSLCSPTNDAPYDSASCEPYGQKGFSMGFEYSTAPRIEASCEFVGADWTVEEELDYFESRPECQNISRIQLGFGVSLDMGFRTFNSPQIFLDELDSRDLGIKVPLTLGHVAFMFWPRIYFLLTNKLLLDIAVGLGVSSYFIETVEDDDGQGGSSSRVDLATKGFSAETVGFGIKTGLALHYAVSQSNWLGVAVAYLRHFSADMDVNYADGVYEETLSDVAMPSSTQLLVSWRYQFGRSKSTTAHGRTADLDSLSKVGIGTPAAVLKDAGLTGEVGTGRDNEVANGSVGSGTTFDDIMSSCGGLSDFGGDLVGTHGQQGVYVEFLRSTKYSCVMDVKFGFDGRTDSYRVTPIRRGGSEVYRADSIGQTRFGKSGCWSTLRRTAYTVFSGYLCGAKIRLTHPGE